LLAFPFTLYSAEGATSQATQWPTFRSNKFSEAIIIPQQNLQFAKVLPRNITYKATSIDTAAVIAT